MARIYDVRDREHREETILTDASGGLLGSQYLAGDPPVSYFNEAEQAQFVLRNKTSGVSISQERETEELTPDDGYQALAVVTDCRIIFLVGRTDEDICKSIELSDVAEATAEQAGLLTGTFRIDTTDRGVWTFPVRDDPSAVATYVDDAAQTWATVRRLTKEVTKRIDESQSRIEQHDFEDARELLVGVPDTLTAATERIDSIGEGARREVDAQVEDLSGRLASVRRELAAKKGGHHHASAQSAWKDDHEFESAAQAYDLAIAEYERALEFAGDDPPTEALRARLEGARKEQVILRYAPMADAAAARDIARAADDPEIAAKAWENALVCYREAVVLDWGNQEWGFEVDREAAQERAAEAANAAIEAHVEAGDKWVQAADKIASDDSPEQAPDAYERARTHYAAAKDLANELRPARADRLRETIDYVDDRLSGDIDASSQAPQSTLSASDVSDVTRDIGSQIASDQESQPTPEEHTTATGQDETQRTQAETVDEFGDDVESTSSTDSGENVPDDDGVTPAIRPVGMSKNDEDAASTPSDVQGKSPAKQTERIPGEPSKSGGNREVKPAITRVDTAADRKMESTGTDSPESTSAESTTASTEKSAAKNAELSDEDTWEALPVEEPSDLLSNLDLLDEDTLLDLTAAVLEQEGWTTRVFSSSRDAVYDLVAFRDDERQLVWTIPRPDGGALGETIVRRCATARDSTPDADRATIVTTGSFTNIATERAAELDVTIVEKEDLITRVDEAKIL